MKRKITAKLIEWKHESASKTAALITGARRVGKSYIVTDFAKAEYEAHLIINFADAEESLKELFTHPAQDLDSFFVFLQGYFGVELPPHRSLIVFDEVQRMPKAREMIKRLVADGRYHYIETGSLMSIRENTKDILIPSEEREFRMGPMDFEEFLWALGEGVAYDAVRYAFDHKTPLGQAMHRKMMTLFRQYIIVGGMPQAVEEYVASRNFRKVDQVKRDILKLYREDIHKHGGDDAVKIEQIFNEIPSQLSQANKRFMFKSISDDARYREYAEALIWLSDSRMVNLCYNTTEPSVGLTTRKDMAAFKCYQGDTGLLISQTFSEKTLAREEIYRKLLFNKLEFNSGMIAENVVAELLLSAGHPLFYYYNTEDGKTEIDFLLIKDELTSRHNILPVEVKSGDTSRITSLNKYRAKFSQQVGMSFILHDGDIKCDNDVTYLPLYMAGLL
ncbi:ATP-binding protein [Candidatus Saccharibacteria bacterium]|nr:ATP-binding protein [Candidatus Saccharibacteria bacterium]